MILAPYNNFPVTSNWNDVYYFENVFDDALIERLDILVQESYTFKKGRTGIAEFGSDTDSYSTNNRDIAYLTPTENTKWLYDLLFPLTLEANSKLFHFDIDIVTDPIHYVIYPEDGGHLDWHMDVGACGVNRRKLALTVELSSPNEYEGGEFEIWTGGGQSGIVRIPRKKGDVIIFPAFLMHRVRPIRKGRRKALVFWTGGRPFR